MHSHAHVSRRCLASIAAAVSALLLGTLAAPHANAYGSPYPDVMLAAFWNSDEDLSDTVYMSYNGKDFQKLSTAYQAVGGGSDVVAGVPSYVHALHDPGLFYRNGTFWMLSGFVQKQEGLGWRYTPMFGSSKDLVHWSYPNSGSETNLKPTVMPEGSKKLAGGQYDTAGTDGFVDDDGDVYVVTTLGYFGSRHGHPQKDQMSPYIVKVSGLEPGEDPAVDPGRQPELEYGDLKPVNLPLKAKDWLDPSIYKENGRYYLSIKKEGVTNQIWSIRDLDDASDPGAWKLVNADVVTGYEGPYLTKYDSQYYYYVDKLKDWPPVGYDGTAGMFMMKSNAMDKGWTAPQRITTTDVNGRSIPNRHGSVITVTDPRAKAVIWKQREAAGYGAYRPGLDGWVEENGKRYWYDHGIRAVSKEVYDPASNAWYWFDADGSMARNKDAYLPDSGKWVRYDGNGRMIKGEDHRYGGWYYFDPVTGAMAKGMVHLTSGGAADDLGNLPITHKPAGTPNSSANGKTDDASATTDKPQSNSQGRWVYYDHATGKMVYGERYLNEGAWRGWYLFDGGSGAAKAGFQKLGNNTVYYSPSTGAMQYGEQYIDDGEHPAGWYLFGARNGVMFRGDIYLNRGNKWVRYDRATGVMVKGLQRQDDAWYYFDPDTGAMAHGKTWVPEWDDWHEFDKTTGRG